MHLQNVNDELREALGLGRGFLKEYMRVRFIYDTTKMTGLSGSTLSSPLPRGAPQNKYLTERPRSNDGMGPKVSKSQTALCKYAERTEIKMPIA